MSHAARNGAPRGPIGVAVLDDHPAVRLGLERVLAREPGILLCGVADGEEALMQVVSVHRPDVVLLDYDLARGDGLTVCQRLKQRPDAPAVLIYSAFVGPALAIPAALAQADGLVDKVQPVDVLLDSIRRAARGEWIGERAPREVLDAASATVAPEDLPILGMLVERTPPSEIAGALGVEPRDVVRRAGRMIARLRTGP